MSDLPHSHPWSTPMFLFGMGAAFVLFGLFFAVLATMPLYIGPPPNPDGFRSTLPFLVAGCLTCWLLAAVALVNARRMIATTARPDAGELRAWRKTFAWALLAISVVSGWLGIASGSWATALGMPLGYGLMTVIFLLASRTPAKHS